MLHDSEVPFYSDYYGQLVGAKITKVEFKREDDDGFTDNWPCFHVTYPTKPNAIMRRLGIAGGTKAVLELSRDEEGNGSGFLFGCVDPRPAVKS